MRGGILRGPASVVFREARLQRARAPACGAHGQQRHHRLPNFARNLSRSFFDTPQKRCNSNDANSMFEQAAGELRAKLMGGGGAWLGFETTHKHTSATQPRWCGGCRRDLPRCRWAAAGPGRASRRRAERSSQRGRRAGGPPPTGTHSGRSLRRPEHPWGHTATQRHKTPRRHNKTARPQWGRAAVAVALGFEPRVAVTPHSISSAAPSAARTRYLTRILYYTLPLRTQIDRAGWEQGHIAVWEQGPARSHNSTRNRRHLTI